MRRRLRKQVTVVATVVLVVGGFLALLTIATYEPPPPPPPPPPTFADLVVRETKILPTGEGRGDVYALVKNPNAQAGARTVRYVFALKNGTEKIATIPGTTFFLPGQEKPVVALNQTLPAGVTDLAVQFTAPSWVQVAPAFREAALVPVSRTTREIPGATPLFEVKGNIANESTLDYLRVEVTAVGRDASGALLGVGKTFVGALLAGEQREYTVSWPLVPGRTTSDVRVFPEVNLLSPDSVQLRAGQGSIEDRVPISPP